MVALLNLTLGQQDIEPYMPVSTCQSLHDTSATHADAALTLNSALGDINKQKA
jgi:hypothetical protein